MQDTKPDTKGGRNLR